MAGDLVAECVHDVVQEVVKDATDLPLSLSLYPVFDGSSYATIPVWTPKSAQGRLVVEFSVAQAGLDLLTTKTILADDDGAAAGQNRFYVNNTNGVVFRYSKIGSSTSEYTICNNSDWNPVAGRRYTAIVEFDERGVTLSLDGNTGNNPIPINSAELNLVAVGAQLAGIDPFYGTIHRCEFADHTPLQGGSFVTGNASGTRAAHLAIPQLPVGSTFDFHYLAKTAAADQVLLGASEASALLTHTDAGTLTFGGDVTVEVDGVAVTSGSHSFNADQHYSIAVTLVNPLTITHIGTDSSDTNGIQLGVIGGVEAFNADTGDLYTLTGKNDSSNLLRNSSTQDRLGAELWGGGTVIADNVAHLTPVVTIPTFFSGQENAPHRIQLTLSGLEADRTIRVYSKGYLVKTLTADGSYTIDLPPTDSASSGFALTPVGGEGGGASSWVIKGLSIRRIHALGTAEGEWDSTIDGYVHPTRWVYDAGTHTYTRTDNLSTATIGLVAGSEYFNKTFEVELTLKKTFGTGTAKLTIRDDDGVPEAYPSFPLSEGFNRVFVPVQQTQQNGFLLLLLTENIGCEISGLRWRQVTHGVWHESGTAMTDAAADAARTDLPRIDQRWKFNKPGQIYEQYSGEQAVLTNLDESDWQKP